MWESSGPVSGLMGGGQGRGGRDYAGIKKKKEEEKKAKSEAKSRKKKGLAPEVKETEEKKDKAPFSLEGIDIDIARGSLTCVVGTVGSGKVS